MGRKLYTATCIGVMTLTLVAVAYKVLASGGISDDTAVLTSGIRIACPDDPLGGEAILVSDPSHPWRVQLEKQTLSPAPEGYDAPQESVTWQVDSGEIKPDGPNGALWTPASESGLHTITVRLERRFKPTSSTFSFLKSEQSQVYTASLQILQPLRQAVTPGDVSFIAAPGGDKFKVGRYPNPESEDDLKHSATPSLIQENIETFQPPKYWYRVDETTKNLRISRSFTLGEFDINRSYLPNWPWPGYIALDPNIVIKLESLIDEMRKGGVAITKFEFIYGFRPPSYNSEARKEDGDTSLKASWSLHMYGKAADIIVDEDKDGRLDDLDKDGQITQEDAKVIRRFVRVLDREYQRIGSPLLGANFTYPHHDFWERQPQTPYIHIDVRGYARSNGTLIQGDYKSTLTAHEQREKQND